ncbi:MAG: lipoprotein [Hydrogenophilus sp.]|nr:lipoprotein [Hydrogenophilus sp.]
MLRLFLLSLSLFILAGCGVKGPLSPPPSVDSSSRSSSTR